MGSGKEPSSTSKIYSRKESCIMADELQSLIDRIQQEGVDKAQSEAAEIITKANAQAVELVKAAKENGQAVLKKAQSDSQVYTERSIKTLQQAARDVLIAVGNGIEKIVKDIISQSMDASLSPEGMMKMIVTIVKAYAEHGMTESRIDVLVSPDDQEKLKKLYMAKCKEALGKEVEIRSDDHIIKGFKISFKDGHVYHDFTQEAIADSLSALVRPKIAEIVHRVAEKQVNKT